MKLLPILLLPILTLTSFTTLAQNGQTLHESKCIECHSRMTGGDGHVIYTRDDRIVNNISELTARVTHCSNGTNTGWNADQIKAVTTYLNEQHYNY